MSVVLSARLSALSAQRSCSHESHRRTILVWGWQSGSLKVVVGGSGNTSSRSRVATKRQLNTASHIALASRTSNGNQVEPTRTESITTRTNETLALAGCSLLAVLTATCCVLSYSPVLVLLSAKRDPGNNALHIINLP